MINECQGSLPILPLGRAPPLTIEHLLSISISHLTIPTH